jgi:hypothetical protein
MVDEPPEPIPVDKESNDQIVHPFGLQNSQPGI